MVSDNVFDGEAIASGYVNPRPPVHQAILARALPSIMGLHTARSALDVGCGAGTSTRALRAVARDCIGIDASPTMIRHACTAGIDARFAVADAAALPIASGSIAMVSAAGTLNFVNIQACLNEVVRVLAPMGTFLVYDFGAGCRCEENDALEHWYRAFLGRWPMPDDGRTEVNDRTFFGAPFEVRAAQRWSVEVPMSVDAYVAYAVTQSNVAAAIRSGIAIEEIRSWCAATLQEVFTTDLSVAFESYYYCLTSVV